MDTEQIKDMIHLKALDYILPIGAIYKTLSTKHIITHSWDLDGTLSKLESFNKDKISEPKDGVIECIKKLNELGDILILSTVRLNPNPFLSLLKDEHVMQGKSIKVVREWLDLHDILDCFCSISCIKYHADIYHDDRGLLLPPKYIQSMRTRAMR